MNKDEILNLAELSRLKIGDDEVESYKKDFEGILSYINSIQLVDIDESFGRNSETNKTRNYMREDDNAYVAGQFTDDILATAPKTQDGYIKVKKVL